MDDEDNDGEAPNGERTLHSWHGFQSALQRSADASRKYGNVASDMYSMYIHLRFICPISNGDFVLFFRRPVFVSLFPTVARMLIGFSDPSKNGCPEVFVASAIWGFIKW